MRLDLVLKTSGIIKRRTIAKELADRGHIQINGKVAKPSSEVKTGDVLTMKLGSKEVIAKVIITTKGKKEFAVFENA